MTKEHTYQESNSGDYYWYEGDYYWCDDDDPCLTCDRDCDGLDMQFCCTRCTWMFEGDTPCDSCDLMDL